MSATYKQEKEKLHDAILEQMKEVLTGMHTLNQNLERLNDVGEELQTIAKTWTTFCNSVIRLEDDVSMAVDVQNDAT